ncbi:TAFII55 protein conserved region-domain-containing protein [Pseudomassariella vexata]|uniref:TAFII55 protein conserved region-domain-containing protein n=1 Tax=Pseudomassariella vexata TaxID=1141098 RepID=A0A1Y2E2Q8_9PEZI|nr:TAFII55 protein conserved region-domain-containing protein [Pseudomassariella vexata]ORY65830.1 TAFII55 protein conserved region-domain-containing protein [Pseudomassariella vexata]
MPPPPTADTVHAAASTAFTEKTKPTLKLNTAARQESFGSETATGSAERKTIKIKVSNSQPSTPGATPVVTKTKVGRTTKPTAKLVESKKRGYESDEDMPMAASRGQGSSSRPAKIQKIKMKTGSGKTPTSAYTPTAPISSIKFRPKGEPVKHKAGEAYDSEASDREEDPVRESVMILRAVPGPSTEYLHKVLEEGLIGVPKASGGADVGIQFIDGKERRAMVTVNGIYYAAVLVDLPTITEAMKSWDRKSMMKNSDVTQMLLCFAEVKNEMEAKAIALPAMAQKTELKWPHGLTPPMHDAIHRRFRKVLSEKQLQSTSATVKKLLADDTAALETKAEYLYTEDEDDGGSDMGDEDAEGEDELDDYFGRQNSVDNEEMAIDELDLEAEFEAADEDMAESETPATQLETPTPMTVEAITPAAPLNEPSDDEGEEEEEDVSDDDEDDDEDELDEEELAKEAERREMHEELVALQSKLADQEKELQTMTNPILKQRILNNMKSVKQEISLKRAALGITDDD